MALDKVLKIYDSEGNEVDYDIRANDVKFQDGESLPDKLAEMEQEIEDAGGYEPPAGGIPKTDLSQGVQDSLDFADSAVQPGDLATVAITGDYDDLTNKPNIPAGVVVDQSVIEDSTNAVSGGAVFDELATKADKSDTYTKQQVDDAIANQLSDVIINNIPAGSVVIVNDLVTGGADNVLSAEMGKRLAIGYGTFAQAWVRSRVENTVFCWMWIETIDGVDMQKPIWHIGNSVFVDAVGEDVYVEASSIPSAPTFSPAIDGQTVPKNTQVTITPASGSALYYKVGSGDWTPSDSAVTLMLSTAGSVTIQAYCANNAGNSSTVTVNATVAGTAVPTISAAPGSILNGSVINRGGSVLITGDKDGTLNYSVDGVAQTPVVGDGVNNPTATVQITNANAATVIVATNTIGGDVSEAQTWSITMDELAAPTMSPTNGYEFPAGGGLLTINGPAGADIYYTDDGTTPDDQSTLYSGSVTINSSKTIKAVAKDTYGYSAVVTSSYTVRQAKIVVTANDATTMGLGESGLTDIPISNGVNEFTIENINTMAGTSYASFADHVFPSLTFGDKTKITKFDGGGVRINKLDNSFNGANALTECVGIVLAPIGADGASAVNAFKTDYANVLAKIELSGDVNGSMNSFASRNSSVDPMVIDLSNLHGTITNAGSMFQACRITSIDLTGVEISAGSAYSMFRSCYRLNTIKVKKMTSTSLPTNMFYSASNIRVLVSTNPTSYDAGWLSGIGSNLTAIYVPDDAVADYKANSYWSPYENIITGISNYNP